MAVTNYYTMDDGMMIGESTNGLMRNYITDAIGSVVGTVLNGVAENTYQYKPYGGVLAKTGTAPDPSFLWNGKSGYRANGLPNAEYYVRGRIVSSTTAQWTTLDFYWPTARGWCYARNNPVLAIDPSGKLAAHPVNLPFWFVKCCGGYASFIDWIDVPEQAGYIIQKIHASDSYYKTCSSNSITLPPIDYFEAWQVTPDGIVLDCPGMTYDDEWVWSGMGPKGADSGFGIAIFVPGTPDGFSVFGVGNVSDAGCLLSASTWDQWGKSLVTATASHQVTTQSDNYTYDCCCHCVQIGPPAPCFHSYTRKPSPPKIPLIDDCPCPLGGCV